jgi:hypothetical protein
MEYTAVGGAGGVGGVGLGTGAGTGGAVSAVVASVGKGVMGGSVDDSAGGIVPGRVTVGVGATDLFVPRGPWASTTTTDAARMEERTMAITAEETFMMYWITLE